MVICDKKKTTKKQKMLQDVRNASEGPYTDLDPWL